MPPLRRRRTALLALAVGLLLIVVVGLAWFTSEAPDATGGSAAGAPSTAASNPTRPGPATTAPDGTTKGSQTGDGQGSAGPGTSGPPAPPAPPCQRVLPAGQAAAVLGGPVARVQSRDGFLVRSCTFWSNGDRYVLVQVHRGVSASRDQFELSRLPADRPVAGVGEAARWTPDTGLLDVLDGGARFQVGLFSPGGAPDAAAPPASLQDLARTIAARL